MTINDKEYLKQKKSIKDMIAKMRDEISVKMDNFNKHFALSNLISEAILQEFKNDHYQQVVPRSLEKLLRQFNTYEVAYTTFKRIEEKLEEKLEKIVPKTEPHKNLLNVKKDLKSRAILYFQQDIYDELEKFDLAGKLKHIKQLLFSPYDNNEYYKKGLLKIEKELDNEIKLIKEEIACRKALEENIEIQDSKNPEFTTTRQVLALRYLLKYAKAKNAKNNAQKNFVHFLTGKDKSTVFKKFDDPNLGYSKDGADLNFVKQQFENIGLSEVVRMIDNDMV